VSRSLLLVTGLLACAASVAHAQRVVAAGDPSLRPARVRLGVDTIAVLVAPPGQPLHLSSVLVRAIARVRVDGRPVLRETQRYDGREPGRPTVAIDTLDVDAGSLQPLRYESWSAGQSRDLRIEGLRVDGVVTVGDSAPRAMHEIAPEAFFPSMMLESFIAALPIAGDAPITIRTANLPGLAFKSSRLTIDSVTTIRTASGPVRCYLGRSTPGDVQYWIAMDDRRLVRLHWTLPNGATVWKLPQRDVPYLP
jgi:hypothetical protein